MMVCHELESSRVRLLLARSCCIRMNEETLPVAWRAYTSALASIRRLTRLLIGAAASGAVVAMATASRATRQITAAIGLRCEHPPPPGRGQCDGQEQHESPYAHRADQRPAQDVLMLDTAKLVGDYGDHGIGVGLGTNHQLVIEHHPASRAKARHVGILAGRPDGRVGHRDLDVRESCTGHQPLDALPQRAIGQRCVGVKGWLHDNRIDQ